MTSRNCFRPRGTVNELWEPSRTQRRCRVPRATVSDLEDQSLIQRNRHYPRGTVIACRNRHCVQGTADGLGTVLDPEEPSLIHRIPLGWRQRL